MHTPVQSARVTASAIAAALTLSALSGCKPGDQQGDYPQPTKAPSFGNLAQGAQAEVSRLVVSYGESLEFDALLGAGDEQLLHVGACPGPCGHGPLARIEPERGAAALDTTQLAAGRVVARIVNGDTVGYPKLGVRPNSVTYWWVDKSAGEWRSLFVSSVPGAEPVVRPLRFDYHPEAPWRRALARWVWDPGDEEAWATCTNSRCCRT